MLNIEKLFDIIGFYKSIRVLMENRVLRVIDDEIYS